MTLTEINNIKSGISFMTDSTGKKTAAVLDLGNKETKELFEDLMDMLTIAERSGEKSRPFDDFKAEVLAVRKAK